MTIHPGWPTGLRETLSNLKAHLQYGQGNYGYCSICDKKVYFKIHGTWLRDEYKCNCCGSIPRWRALMQVIAELYPDWRSRIIHESSPGGPLSEKLARECKDYVGTHYFQGEKVGSTVSGILCEDITRQTFSDETFDVVVTSDVFEHVFNAERGFREITRTLPIPLKVDSSSGDGEHLKDHSEAGC